MSDTITKTIFMEAPREVVWGFLTDAEKLGQWYHPAGANLEDGGDYALNKADGTSDEPMIWGRILKFDPPRQLRMTFEIPPFGGKDSVVTFRLDDVDGGTRLTLTHSEVARALDGESALGILLKLDAGWDDHLGKLRGAVQDAAAEVPAEEVAEAPAEAGEGEEATAQ